MDDSDSDEPLITRRPRHLASHVARSRFRKPLRDENSWRESESTVSLEADSQAVPRVMFNDEEDNVRSKMEIPQLKNVIETTGRGMNRKRATQYTRDEERGHDGFTQTSSRAFEPPAKRRRPDFFTQAGSPVLGRMKKMSTDRTSLQELTEYVAQVANGSMTESLSSNLFSEVDPETAHQRLLLAFNATPAQSPKPPRGENASKAHTATTSTTTNTPPAKAQASRYNTILQYRLRGAPEGYASPKPSSTLMPVPTAALVDLTAPPQSSTSPGTSAVSNIQEVVEQRRKAELEALKERFQKEQARVELKREEELSRVEKKHREEDRFEEDKVIVERCIETFLNRRAPWETDQVKQFVETLPERANGWIACQDGRKGTDGT